MRSSAFGLLRGLILGASAVGLAACGGGGSGGSGGGIPGGPSPSNEYKVRIVAERTNLPLNVDAALGPPRYFPSSSSPYATALYVEAFRENTRDPIPGGDDVFGCFITSQGEGSGGGGIESGALYYFQGRDEDKVTVVGTDGEEYDIEGAYRSITLGANSGGASFHLLSKDKVGSITVRCSVTDPQSGRQAFDEIRINVGPATNTGNPAQIRVSKTAPTGVSWGFMYPQGLNDPTMLRVQAELLDENGQRVNNPSADNVRACLIGTTGSAPTQAYLQSGAATSGFTPMNTANGCVTGVTARTINGMAEFSIHSGTTSEILTMLIETDRADNNVVNGIAQRVYNIVTVPVLFVNPTGAPLMLSTNAVDFYTDQISAIALSISGGIAPYSCSVQGGYALPAGLTLSECALFGRPLVTAGTSFVVQIGARDSAVVQGESVSNVLISVFDPVSIVTSSLPPATNGEAYEATIQASGGKPALSFSATGLPAGLSMSDNVISGTPAVNFACNDIASETFTVNVTVTDANGRAASASLSMTVSNPDFDGVACP